MSQLDFRMSKSILIQPVQLFPKRMSKMMSIRLSACSYSRFLSVSDQRPLIFTIMSRMKRRYSCVMSSGFTNGSFTVLSMSMKYSRFFFS